MKALKVLTLSLVLSLASVSKTHAAAGLGLWAFGAPAAGKVALTGLYTIGGGVLVASQSSNGSENWFGVLVLVTALSLGVLFLDEEGHFQFDQLSEDEAQVFNVTQSELEIYNQEVEEANMIFEEVRSQLHADSQVEEAELLWHEVSEFVSPETFLVMKKLAVTAK